ncbi:Uncharacterised protein [Mycobacteroides abscessus]|nr:Uncharacterised protein [Mycobacteroides abscessus]
MSSLSSASTTTGSASYCWYGVANVMRRKSSTYPRE